MTVRLFQVFDVKENKPVEGFFSNKQLAKEKRKSLNVKKEGKEIFRFVVTLGPDHHKFKGR